jgi:hypothetical protein
MNVRQTITNEKTGKVVLTVTAEAKSVPDNSNNVALPAFADVVYGLPSSGFNVTYEELPDRPQMNEEGDDWYVYDGEIHLTTSFGPYLNAADLAAMAEALNNER